MTSRARYHSFSSSLPRFESATIADVMSPGIMSCPPSSSLVTVAQTMTAHNVHAVVVSEVPPEPIPGDQRLWGLVSDMDLIRAIPAGIRGHTAGEFAHTEAIGIERSTALATAATAMVRHDSAHLVVTDDERPIGMVSSLDLAASLALGGD
jgi:CBS domain-containing protein